MPGSNSAQRVSNLIERAVTIDSNAAMVNGLNQLFEYSPQDPYRQHAHRLEQVLRQLDLIETGLARKGVPDELYVTQLASLRNGFSPQSLIHQFQNLRGVLSADVRLALRWAAYILDDEGGIEDQQALGELVKAIAAVIDDVEASSLPATLRDFLTSHLIDLLTGLQTSPFAGAGELQKAVKSLAADVVAQGRAIAESSEDLSDAEAALMERAGGAFEKAAGVAGRSGKGSDGIATLWRMASKSAPPRLGWDRQTFEQLGSPSPAGEG